MADVLTSVADGACRTLRRDSSCAVRFFLARALSPRVQANGRWIGVNALRRKAYAISGKEPGSPLLATLAGGSAASDPAYERAAAQLGLGEDLAEPGYLPWFRALNEGYPFLDYSQASTQAVDAELMGAYAAAEPPPPVATSWPGRRLALPEGRLEQNGAAQPPSLELMAAWLRLAAGATHLAPIRHSIAAYKTSPSGGARHPTDLGIGVGAAWPEALRGGGWYDGVDHALAAGETPPAAPAAADDPRAVVFTVSSHVRRAMWRYRDPRAVRPVAIDAGHVVETLVGVIRASGWRAWWEPAPGFTQAGGDLDPVFGYVLAAPAGECPARGPSPRLVREARAAGPFRSNPLISLTPSGSGMRAENHAWPDSSLSVSPAMIDALAWSTPSSRNDRPTRPDDLIERYVSEAELEALIGCGLLLDLDEGDALWAAAKPWFDHDWYLSLLALACEGDGAAGGSPREASERVGPGLARALDRRRTSRSFSGDPPPPERADFLLGRLREMAGALDVVLTLFAPFGALGEGVYRVSPEGIEPLPVPLPDEEQVRAAAIGQPWARNFGLIVWLIPRGGDRPGEWIGSFVQAGRSAQQLALGLADLAEVGIFQSPALVDQVMPTLIGDAAATDGAYMIGLGTVREQVGGLPKEETRRFLPSDLIACQALPL